MITGVVNAEFEPIIPLSIRRFDGKVYTRDAIVDTGFNGWLLLSPDLIAQLNLKWKRRGERFLEMVVSAFSTFTKRLWSGMELY